MKCVRITQWSLLSDINNINVHNKLKRNHIGNHYITTKQYRMQNKNNRTINVGRLFFK